MESVEQNGCSETQGKPQPVDVAAEAQNFMEMYTHSTVKITYSLMRDWIAGIVHASHTSGYKIGYEDGFRTGTHHESKMYDTGYADGHRTGYKDGYHAGSRIGTVESYGYPGQTFGLGLQPAQVKTDAEVAKNVLDILKTSMSAYGSALNQSQQADKYLPEAACNNVQASDCLANYGESIQQEYNA